MIVIHNIVVGQKIIKSIFINCCVEEGAPIALHN